MTPMNQHDDEAAARPAHEDPQWWGAPHQATAHQSPAAEAPSPIGLGPAPVAPRESRGPGWAGVSALVLGGMLLSSGLTLGGVVAYDQLTGPGPQAPSSTASPGADEVDAATSASPAALDAASSGWEQVAAEISPSTVAIQVTTAGRTGEGTGVIYREDGTIITNNHVVAGAQSVTVSLADGRMYEADVVGTDPTTDLAVVRLQSPPADLVAATLGDSDEVTVGQSVMAVGTPLGLENTVTTGIISAVHRPVATQGEESDGSDAAYTSALQTDAAINPGNSGGPLVDASGAVIGINSSIASFASSTTQQAGSIGLGFAIPSNTVRLIVDQLVEKGEADHALLGVDAQNGTAQANAATFQGAEIREVTAGSAAEAAGLQAGDLITDLDGVPISGASALTGVVRSLGIGSTHTLTVVREGQTLSLQVTFAQSS
ncbi:trypsin-like peptidase domain-containing protein [Brachybacterium sp. JHP9]|uniref:Trypsin-like peptidase domain-containing protein n=1 Tax=Brachybacterium equifaecis TaxID=2910770 RepID=A0ABT0QYW2_9MICO|nr:trypsin-like peptidase domain-containing protein [Brachybacterium equifaecis]MCL6422842.1 trypsin-like peptidase domain-containing protein [Brachybacterium equifaecis]